MWLLRVLSAVRRSVLCDTPAIESRIEAGISGDSVPEASLL